MIAKYADRIQDPRYTFLPGDEFFEQVRVIESAEKDILAHRDLFSDVKENRGAVTSSPTLKVETAAALLSTANVYQNRNKSNSPGLAHPEFSTDARGNIGVGPSNKRT